ncbi:hypothetical protein KY285_020581 [Solanum tuberosum]|nr:hypothetical protein KY285_020581 [Solanum tuberosum]
MPLTCTGTMANFPTFTETFITKANAIMPLAINYPLRHKCLSIASNDPVDAPMNRQTKIVNVAVPRTWGVRPWGGKGGMIKG